MFLKALPHTTGTIFICTVPVRIAARISSSAIASPFRYFSMTRSLTSASASTMRSRAALAASRSAAGISSSR